MRADKKFFKEFDKLGIDKVVDLYIEHRTVGRLLESLGYSAISHHRLFYKWLHRDKSEGDDNRWQRWQEGKIIKAHGHIDKMSDEADTIDEENYKQRRVSINAHDLAAQRLAPRQYGTRTVDVNVNSEVTVKHQWFEGMKELAERQRLERESRQNEILVEPGSGALRAAEAIALPDPSEDDEVA